MTKKSSGLFSSVIQILNENFFLILIVVLVFALGFLAGSRWQTRQAAPATNQEPAADVAGAAREEPEADLTLTPAVTDDDHIQGASNPQLTLIEYSDFSCGFCGRVHPTLKQVAAQYPDQVAWVYRHYLLSPTGPSRLVAETSECIAEYQGNQAFWNFIGEVFSRASTDRSIFEKENLSALVTELGLNQAQIEDCVESGEFSEKIDATIAGGRAAGVRGTPAIILVTADGEYDMIAGAAPYEAFVEKIEEYLK